MTTHRGSLSLCTWAPCALVAALALSGCSDTMRVETDMKGQLATTLKLDGPIQIQMQMQGPTIKYEGTYISDELLERVQIGKATDEWMIAVLGKPDAEATLKDGSQIWRWTYRPVEQQASVVEVFSKSEKEPKLATRSVFVTLRGGIVTEKWKG
ncbi:MAG: hypothetical protein ACKVS8_03200 [Phycisphaerales bacterium]